MTLSAREQWYPAMENGAPVKGVIGRFELQDVEFIKHNEGEPPETVTKKIPHLLCKTTMSPDCVPEKLPLDPLERRRMIERFPQAWAAFQGEYVEEIGTPLDREFKGMTLGANERMRYEMVGISAWEQLADISDLGCDQMGLGVRKRRDDIMRAMGRTPPGEVPLQVSAQYGGMDALTILRTLPGGEKIIADAARREAEAKSAPDLTDPVIQAAIQGAVQAALAAVQPAPKRVGWPKGKPRGKKAPAVTEDYPVVVPA
jgi:hypothetical protein